MRKGLLPRCTQPSRGRCWGRVHTLQTPLPVCLPTIIANRWGASLGDKPHGYSLLHLAAGVGALPSVTFLLDTGADPNGGLGGRVGGWVGGCAAQQPGAALRAAAGRPEGQGRCCRAGASEQAAHLRRAIDLTPSLPSLPLSLACGAERSNAEGATPLHSAALGGCARCTEALLAAGGDAGLADAEGQLPADMAEVCAEYYCHAMLEHLPEPLLVNRHHTSWHKWHEPTEAKEQMQPASNPCYVKESLAKSLILSLSHSLLASRLQDARVKELLKPKSGAKGAKPAAKPRSGGAAAEGGPLPAQEQFRALSQVGG